MENPLKLIWKVTGFCILDICSLILSSDLFPGCKCTLLNCTAASDFSIYTLCSVPGDRWHTRYFRETAAVYYNSEIFLSPVIVIGSQQGLFTAACTLDFSIFVNKILTQMLSLQQQKQQCSIIFDILVALLPSNTDHARCRIALVIKVSFGQYLARYYPLKGQHDGRVLCGIVPSDELPDFTGLVRSVVH